MVDHLVFDLPNLLLNYLLIAQHIVKLGWDCVNQIKDASRRRTYCQYCKASQGFLLDPTPKPRLLFRGRHSKGVADLILPNQPLPWPLYRFFPLRSGREWRPAPIEVVLGFDALRCSEDVPVFDLTAKARGSVTPG
jgi:hypothetical protein